VLFGSLGGAQSFPQARMISVDQALDRCISLPNFVTATGSFKRNGIPLSRCDEINVGPSHCPRPETPQTDICAGRTGC
jgi:hypothetical protein